MAKKIYGLEYLKLGQIASDGGMGTSLITIGETVEGTPKLSQEDNTTTEFKIEESDSAIASFISSVGNWIFEWSSYNIKYYVLQLLFGGTGNMRRQVGSINVLGAITGGSSYVNGFYENVPLTGGAGAGARANITVAGGAVTIVELTELGSGYAAANSLSASNANLGGAGSGFAVAVTSVFSVAASESWSAPDSFTELELSLEAKDKNGNIMQIPRIKIAAKLSSSFTRQSLGQMDFSGKILQPTKSGVSRAIFSLAN
jgi:hypothetical protein